MPGSPLRVNAVSTSGRIIKRLLLGRAMRSQTSVPWQMRSSQSEEMPVTGAEEPLEVVGASSGGREQ